MPGYNYDSLIARAPGGVSSGTAASSSGVPGWLWLVVIGGIAVILVVWCAAAVAASSTRPERREAEGPKGWARAGTC